MLLIIISLTIRGTLTRYEGFSGSSMMGTDDIVKIYKMLKHSLIIPVYMDSYPHCTYTIKTMKKFVNDNKLEDRVIVAVDGEIIEI